MENIKKDIFYAVSHPVGGCFLLNMNTSQLLTEFPALTKAENLSLL